ncbi:hypothetical protein BC828DRAFT_387207 [Blastocladiella britannica]|nr:hypothetical protein BC828DRAFT_387207 [Blastocladiella britannica]
MLALTALRPRPSAVGTLASICATPVRFRHATNLYPTYLTEDVANVGKNGDIVMLRAGHARNFILGTNKGLMIPRDERGFRSNMTMYRTLGFPVETVLKYYDGAVAAVPRAQATTKSASLRSLAAADQSAVAALIAARAEVARVLRASVEAAPIRIRSAADERGALFGSVTVAAILEELSRRGIVDLSLAIKHAEQIYIKSDEGKIRKVKTTGTFEAGVNIPLVGAVPFQVIIESTSGILTAPTPVASTLVAEVESESANPIQ